MVAQHTSARSSSSGTGRSWYLICKTVCDACRYVAHWLREQEALGEESITDWLLWHLSRELAFVRYRKINKHEEAKLGADWEWWFIGSKLSFGMRVQAKRLRLGDDHYPDLARSNRYGLQIENLIATADSKRLLAFYCLYHPEGASPLSNCPAWFRDPNSGSAGAGFRPPTTLLMAAARRLHGDFIKAGRQPVYPDDLVVESLPLACWFCCPRAAAGGDPVQGLLSQLRSQDPAGGASGEGPRLFHWEELPQEVRELLTRGEGKDHDTPPTAEELFEQPPEDVDALVVFDLRGEWDFTEGEAWERRGPCARIEEKNGTRPTTWGNGHLSCRMEAQVMITREAANEILKSGYPNDEQIAQFPLGDVLLQIPKVDDRYPTHIRKVVEGMNILLSGDFHRIVADWDTTPVPREANGFKGAWNRIFLPVAPEEPYCRFEGENRDFFFRMLALYHDIGKSISTERHPTIGWHLLRDIHKERVLSELYPLLLGRDQDDWQKQLIGSGGRLEAVVTTPDDRRLLSLFNLAILYHDYFGVLSTGEASLPLAVDLVPFRSTSPADIQEIFSILMIFNLADLYGSVEAVSPKMAEIFCYDWRILCKKIEEVGGERESFLECLTDMAQTHNSTIDRIWRLMFAGSSGTEREQVTPSSIEKSFREIAFANTHRFIRHFALFCKLDYCLGFKLRLMREVGGSLVTPGINAMMSILVALETRYGHLCCRSDGSWRRIGIQMAALTRRPPSPKGAGSSNIAKTIARLLLSPEGVGRDWAVGDCTVWFMED